MTLQQLKYVIELSKHNSISSAAQSLSISQPSLSMAVKELEEEFHITILNRNHRGVSFTAQGLDFLRFARSIIEQTSRLQTYFDRSAGRQDKAHLTIAAHYDIFAADAFTSYLQTLSGDAYSLSLCEGRTGEVIRQVAEQQSQIGVLLMSPRTTAYNHAVFTKHNLDFTGLKTVSPCLYVRSAHPLAQSASVSLKDLVSYPHVKMKRENTNNYLSEELLPDIRSEKEIQVTDRNTMFSIIKNTNAYALGACRLPQGICCDGICSIPIHTANTLTVGWIHLKGISIAPECRHYLEWLEHCLQASQPDPD